ncbi:M3 family oligoendopeptidase [Acidithiobacillus montserratensis]|uniref:M3 family oligoendopeptidase n=1 Tax=Acidithiobacillus montserratensis TaxID=2729135 RepID=A0ACD5HE60_9PROT|nr:M3 family oligoendopeptidase [Acidithiobacillus montserratensis]MBN2678798.1 M3 family oligoendopeptidase [Acidithiobacillaceae bacterium]MBU2748820.1 M3 family oligoendopeptidase [Acidithiobacillus montserratensis]
MVKQVMTGAENIHWHLQDLYTGMDDPQIEADMRWANTEAENFARRYRPGLDDLDAAELAVAMQKLEAIRQRLGRVGAFRYLSYVTHADQPGYGAALQAYEEAATSINNQLIFFDIAWNAVDDARAEAWLQDPALATWAHLLRNWRKYRNHLRSESEEQILSEKRVTGRALWERLFDETLTEMRFQLRGKAMTEQEVLTLLSNPDRSLRHDAAESLSTGLESRLHTLTTCFNAILADKALDDRLRAYPHWLSERNLSNEISDNMVEALEAAVVSRYSLVARYYRLKAKLLRVSPLMDYDRYAPISSEARRYDWAECQRIVLAAVHDFSPELGAIGQRFFAEHWIDAALAPGKRGGAFAHPVTPDVHPYLMVNYTGTVRDVMTVAHELGHGIHQYLAREQGYLNADTPLTTAETASVFGEMLTFERLMREEQDPQQRLTLLCGKIEDTFATVFRQMAMHRFEVVMHQARRTEGELSKERLAELWMQTQTEQFADSIQFSPGYRWWWSYIPHFIGSPGYVYAYAFGELLTLALIQRYRDNPAGFVPGYIAMLKLGGSKAPAEVVAETGVDLDSPQLWSQALDYLASLVDEAEALAGAR